MKSAKNSRDIVMVDLIIGLLYKHQKGDVTGEERNISGKND